MGQFRLKCTAMGFVERNRPIYGNDMIIKKVGRTLRPMDSLKRLGK